MSVQAIAWVFDNSESRFADRLVLLAIANHCDKYGREAWPMQTTIAAEARVSTREVVRAIQNLVSISELIVEKGKGQIGRNRYSLPGMGAQADRQILNDKLSLEKDDLSDKSCTSQVTNPSRNKEEPSLTVLNLSPPSSGDGNKNHKDPRYKAFIEAVNSGYKKRRWEFGWGPPDGAQLKALLTERKEWTLDIFRTCLKNYFESDGVVPGDQPRAYLRKLPRYINGPLDRFGKLRAEA
jgi:hypothetical protein